MALYARPSARRVRQLAADLFTVGWIALWAWAGVRIWSAIMAVAEPARRTAAAATQVREDFTGAAQSAGGIPVAGQELRRPFDSAAGSLDQIVAAANDQVQTLENLALLCGVLVFLMPVALVLAFWLPARIRFVRQSGAVQTLIDSGADLDLFALRAIATQPMHELAEVSADPVGDWRAGEWPVIVALADLELKTAGLRVPKAARGAPPARFRSDGDDLDGAAAAAEPESSDRESDRETGLAMPETTRAE